MAIDKPLRRLPLRDLMTDAEKRARDLVDHFNTTWFTRLTDLRDLSRPVRRKSHYPTLQALINAVNKLASTAEDTEKLFEVLNQELEEIREHARRERLNRG